MVSGWDWGGDESLLRFDDPAEWDAAYARGEGPLGSAVIGLAFNCSLAEASPRIVRAMRLPDLAERGFAFTAAGVAARLNGELTPELYAALRVEGPGSKSIAGNPSTTPSTTYRSGSCSEGRPARGWPTP
ncbi:hypothetical protein AB0I02_25190 [Streptomyces phaeochromogenes]